MCCTSCNGHGLPTVSHIYRYRCDNMLDFLTRDRETFRYFGRDLSVTKGIFLLLRILMQNRLVSPLPDQFDFWHLRFQTNKTASLIWCAFFVFFSCKQNMWMDVAPHCIFSDGIVFCGHIEYFWIDLRIVMQDCMVLGRTQWTVIL